MTVRSGRDYYTLNFITPGKPQQNAFVESFNNVFRDECLNTHWFRTIDHARATIEQWRHTYNTVRTHGSLGRITPAAFARRNQINNLAEVSTG